MIEWLDSNIWQIPNLYGIFNFENYKDKWLKHRMSLDQLERNIYNCPFTKSSTCKGRLNCHPIPGCGSEHPDFLVLGLNPALRGGIWCSCNSLESLKEMYCRECVDTRYGYGKLLKSLEGIIPRFNVPKTAYLSDIVRCPVVKGKPSKMMSEQCTTAYLEKTIQALKPKFIIGLGDLPAKMLGRFTRTGKNVKSMRIAFGEQSYWFVSAPHPSQGADTDAIAANIKKVIDSPEAYAFTPLRENSWSKIKEAKTRIVKKLTRLGYEKQDDHMVKGNKAVTFSCSSQYGSRIRILWKEHWKADYVHIFDYWAAGGPTCIVPIVTLFESDFINKKKNMDSHDNNPYFYKNKKYYWWTQIVPQSHELAQLILSFKERWDLL